MIIAWNMRRALLTLEIVMPKRQGMVWLNSRISALSYEFHNGRVKAGSIQEK